MRPIRLLLIAALPAIVLAVTIDSIRASQPEDTGVYQWVARSVSVDLDATYNLDRLSIPREQIHTLLPRDAIPALTDPALEPAADAEWLFPRDRVFAVTVGDETLGFPFRILNFHEIVNTTLGGEPVAATYCPLCDSATVFSRRVQRTGPEGQTRDETLEFGVSGALYNSNVLMYDQSDMALWSQLGMRAVSGPLAGISLRHLPVRIITFEEFVREHPDANVVSRETGHNRNYAKSPYEDFFRSDRLLVPVMGVGEALPPKTLGLGVLAGGNAYFVVADAIGEGFELPTPLGPVRAERTGAGVRVLEAPAQARTAQTFYYAWSAFHPRTRIIGAPPPEAPDG
jgi:hypothetical protein